MKHAQSIPPRTNSAPASERDKKTKHCGVCMSVWQTDIQTPHFRTYSRRTLFDLPQTLHGGRAHPKNWETFFNPIHSFSTRGHNADF